MSSLSNLQSLKHRIFTKCIPSSYHPPNPLPNTRNKSHSTLFPSHSFSLSKNRTLSTLTDYTSKPKPSPSPLPIPTSRLPTSKCLDFTSQSSLMQNLEIWDNTNIPKLPKKYPRTFPHSNSTSFPSNTLIPPDFKSISSSNLAMLDLYSISTNTLLHNLNSLAPHLKQEQINSEQTTRSKLFHIYHELLNLQFKKKRYKHLYKETYSLLNTTEKEYSFLIEILTDKLLKVKQYYKSFIDIPQLGQNVNTKAYNEKIKKHKEYKELNNELTSEILKYQNLYTNAKKSLNNDVEDTKDKLEEISQKIRNSTIKFKQLQEEQQKYYLTILKEGSDTRKEGLTWVIEALLEIQYEPSNADFPFYLNQEQIDYLLRMAKLNIEMKQLKAMIPTLLNRRRRHYKEVDELKKRISLIKERMFELMKVEFMRYVEKYSKSNEKENTIKAQHHNKKVYAALFGTKLFV